MVFKIILLLSISFLFSTNVFAEGGDSAKGKKSYVICAPCHGTKGEGSLETNAPRLQGQHSWYLIRQLNNFKKGIRGAHSDDIYGQQMQQMAMTLADEQAINDVVAYIRTLE